jgi:hypothetical protein
LGLTLSDEDGGAMTISGGLQTSVRIAADLIAATFGEADE